MSNTIIIKQDFVLAFHFQALIVLFFGTGILTTFFANPTILTVSVVVLVSILPILLAMSRYRVILNAEKQQVIKSVRILGLHIRSNHYQFHQIERLFLNRIRTSQRLASFVSQREFNDILFKTFIKFHDGEKWFLDEDHDYEKLRSRTLDYKKVVWAPFVDNFRGEVID
ncbi:MAG: hypothetical protein AB7K37_12940 [Cyclobacteriaceae bacterium]